MNVQTADRLYDELTLLIGARLKDVGACASQREIETIVGTERELEDGLGEIRAIGRMVVDSGDLALALDAMACQQEKIVSVQALQRSAMDDQNFASIQRRDLAAHRARLRMLQAHVGGDQNGLVAAAVDLWGMDRRRYS